MMGLGDTNYDKFCHMGKAVDRRMCELGGARLFDVVCADEVEGMEMFVHKFYGLVIPMLKQAYAPKPSAASIMARITGAHGSHAHIPVIATSINSVNIAMDAKRNSTPNPAPSPSPSPSPALSTRSETPAAIMARISGSHGHTVAVDADVDAVAPAKNKTVIDTVVVVQDEKPIQIPIPSSMLYLDLVDTTK